jgi:hypothetical protein
MMYSINPFVNGPYYQQQPILSSWPYPVYKSAENIEGPTSRQPNIACGVGPSSPPEKNIPTVSIVGGSEATPNSWPFVVSVDPFLTKRFDELIIINKQTLIKNSYVSHRWV